MQHPGTVACARCGKALPATATFCDGCGARIALHGATAAGVGAAAIPAAPTARPGFVAAGRGMPICHRCGAIAPTRRSTCGTCGAPIGTSLEAVPPRADGACWVQVRSELTCRQCGKRSPLDALDLDGSVSCGHCGVAQAFDLDVWSEGLAFAHAVADLAAPELRARDGAIPGGNPYAEIGTTLASATLEETGVAIQRGVMKTRNLSLVATPGQPLCAICACPVEVAVQGDRTSTRCIGCGDRAEHRFPMHAKAMAPGLVAAIGDDLRVDRPDARLDSTSAGMVIAARCPSCGAGLDVAEGAHATRCTYCGTECRIPSRTLLALKRSPGAAAPWWMLFQGPSELRHRLTRPRDEEPDEPEERSESDASELVATARKAKRNARKHKMLPIVHVHRTPADEALAWALQIAVPLALLALVGVVAFGPVLLAWAHGKTSTDAATVGFLE